LIKMMQRQLVEYYIGQEFKKKPRRKTQPK
jgi:hypothetical protein